MGKIVLEDFYEGNGHYKVNLAYLNKEQVKEIESLVSKWKPTDEYIKSCIEMCLTDANEQRFKDYGTNLKDCLDWLEKRSNTSNKSTDTQEVEVGNDNIKALVTEEIPIDKVEPKFHKGDWITDGNSVLYITNMDYGFYQFENSYDAISIIDEKYHLWTIQDAKDGDVLAGRYGTFIFMSESDGYCGVLSDNTFIRNTGNNEWTEGLHPATKEQRGNLKKAMANAGYEFDFKKKELKKIENTRPMLSDFFNAVYERGKADALKCVGWSEEDMFKVQRICKYLNEAKKYYADITEIRDCIDWLKSIKDRYTWKPSKGQLECLSYAIDKVEKDYNPLANNRIYLTLKVLKEQLEKL